jgi:nucleoside-diphosphate-sugar epimerase
MNVFITGATGVLGRTVTRLLVDSGHHVRALARNAGNESRLRDAGAEPARGSLFDLTFLRNAIEGCDAILHLATHIPPMSQAAKRDSWRENDKIRTEGTRNLVNVALDTGVSSFVYPGIVFIYPDRDAAWIDSSTPPAPTVLVKSSLDAEAEVNRFTNAGRRGIVLRMGSFYGPGAESSRDMLRTARRGYLMLFGRSKAYVPMLWIDDAALAVLDALAQAPAGIYDIVDDEPLQRKELTAALAQTVGRRWLLRPPTLLLWILSGRNAAFLARSQRVSNRKFKEATNWTPMITNAKLGFRLLSIPP